MRLRRWAQVVACSIHEAWLNTGKTTTIILGVAAGVGFFIILLLIARKLRLVNLSLGNIVVEGVENLMEFVKHLQWRFEEEMAVLPPPVVVDGQFMIHVKHLQ
ncbi:hypothetical protein L2E82_48446 [Cichorium intybus]|uniref:Uncharacterized protein n=1 Tax=Cichorium intybus TaxID=13427 RepID=A0ACB8YYX8_CICIN|nr:hypothetical protein L2E82_48446 [Cichorium intybus]